MKNENNHLYKTHYIPFNFELNSLQEYLKKRNLINLFKTSNIAVCNNKKFINLE